MKTRFLILTLLALIPPAHAQAQNKELATLVEGNNQFAFDLYAKLGQKPGNKFFSPYSISTALAMTYAGARGNTETQMARVLHFGKDQPQLHSAFGALQRQFSQANHQKGIELSLANALWAQGLFPSRRAALRRP